jgi:ATP-binding cassette, subfamily B, bacterial
MSSPAPAAPSAPNFLTLMVRTTSGVWRFFSPELRAKSLQVTGLATILAGFPVVRTAIYSTMLNLIVELAKTHSMNAGLLWSCAALIVLDLVQNLLRWQNRTMQLLIRNRSDQFVSLKVWEKFGSLDVASLEDSKRQILISKVRNDEWMLFNYTDGFTDLIGSAFQWIFAAGVLLWTHPVIFVVAMIGSLPEMVVEFCFGRKNWAFRDAQADNRRLYHAVEDFFGSSQSLSEMKIFQTLKKMMGVADKRMEVSVEAAIQLERERARANSGANFFAGLVLASVTVWGIWLVWKGQMNLGGFTFLLGTVEIARSAMSSFFGSLARQYESALFADDFLKMMAMEPIIKAPLNGRSISSIDEIAFENVSFRYPSSEKEILSNISFKITKGEKVALVGLNGSGKTTLIKLLCRFYDPTAGRVLINGIDLREVDLESYYAQTAALFQDFLQYFSFDVSAAIALGRSDIPADEARLQAAAKDSEASEFINSLKGGYKQILGEWFTDGVGLSGGQWQKLALARTFYRKAGLVVLDEPTSAVDAQAEAHIFEKIASMGKEQTALFISHRFSTVRQANRIMMLEGGRITEDGPHEELLAHGASYARLYKLQARAFETVPPFGETIS